MIMFGFAMVTGLLDFTLETCETVVRRELRDADANMAAIRLGMERGRDVLKK